MDLRPPWVTLALGAVGVALLALGLQHSAPTESLSGAVHSQGQADQRAQSMLARAYVPGAVRVAGPPSLTLSTRDSVSVQRGRWYTVVGSMDTVAAVVRSHPPTGLEVSRELYMLSTASGATSGRILEFTGANPANGSLDVAVVPMSHHRVSLHLEAVVGWTES